MVRKPRPSTPRDRDVNQKAREHGVAEVWQDAKDALNYSVRTYFTKSGITYLQRTITLPDDVRVRGSHSVTIDEPGKIRITFYPGAVDLCHEHFPKLKEAIPFEAEKPPNAPATRRAPHQWYCRLNEASWQNGKVHLIDFARAMEDAWRKHVCHQVTTVAGSARARPSAEPTRCRPHARSGGRPTPDRLLTPWRGRRSRHRLWGWDGPLRGATPRSSSSGRQWFLRPARSAQQMRAFLDNPYVSLVARAVPEPVQKLPERNRRQQHLLGATHDPAHLLAPAHELGIRVGSLTCREPG